MKKMLTLLLSTWVIYCAGQDVNWAKLDYIQPDSILQRDLNPIPVLLLGTFHFDYPGLDDHKIAEENKMDVLNERRQKEIKDLIHVIENYNPTKIYIESRNQAYHDSLFSKYVNEDFTLGRSEIYQIAYRLGKKLNLQKLYAVDASTLLEDISTASDNEKNCLNQLYDEKYNLVNESNDRYWHKLYAEMYNQVESIQGDLTLLESFIMMSKPKLLKIMHGHYLSSGFNTLDHQGPDRLALWWYTRNLRIFNNILNTQPTEDDRILVLFGNGHMSILNHLFESAPQFEIVTLKNLICK